jgi:hypothetical protein
VRQVQPALLSQPGDKDRFDLLFGERSDVLRRKDNGLGLVRREVFLDHSTLPIDSISVLVI